MNTLLATEKVRHRFWLFIEVFSIFAVVAIFIASPDIFGAHRASAKANDLSNIRSLGQAALIYAEDHQNQLPRATSVWDYAHQLFLAGNLSDESIWHSLLDPATDLTHPLGADFFLTQQSSESTLRFKPSIAVPLGQLDATKMPATTPIAWMRGLRPDGTWSPSSPYGTSGGYIVFMGGNVKFYSTLTTDGGQLARFDGQGKTANILKALPPGTRIGEYTPTTDEQTAWPRAIVRQRQLSALQNYLPPEVFRWGLLLGLPVLLFIFYRPQKNLGRAIRLLIAILVILALLVVLFPSIC